MSAPKRIHSIEAFTISESFDSIIDRHFRGRCFHRAEDHGPYAVDRLVNDHADKVVRSRQERVCSPSGMGSRFQWSSLCLRWAEDVFVILLIKGNASWRERSGEDEFRVTVTAASPEMAARALDEIRQKYHPVQGETGPAFFIFTDHGRAQRAPLEPRHRLTADQLALHYGDDFPAWARDFEEGLSEPGISILRGDPGTGKTYFLRHVMCSLASTHRFFFVPVDAFGLLSSGNLTEFWQRDQRHYPDASRVLVLEDAEALLLERDHGNRSPVATILNLTDGLLTQVVSLHLLCTLNCKLESMDKALLRPGRLRFFRNFELIPRERALRLAQYYNVEPPNKSECSLADIFASPQFQKHTAAIHKPSGPVGFGQR